MWQAAYLSVRRSPYSALMTRVIRAEVGATDGKVYRRVNVIDVITTENHCS